MSVADLYNVPKTDAEMHVWSFNHMVHHRLVNAYLLKTKRINLPEYILDPMPVGDVRTFLLQHQTMHNNTDALTGVSGYDLTEVDWTKPEQRAGWIWLNAQLHVAEANATGVFG